MGRGLQGRRLESEAGRHSQPPWAHRPVPFAPTRIPRSRARLHSPASAHLSTAPPASRARPGSPAGRRLGQQPLRTHARPPGAPLPRPQPGVVQPAALGSFQHRAPGAPSPLPAAAKPPAPPAEAPARPSPAPPGIVRTLLAGRSGWACSRLQRSILRAQWPCRLPRHKAGALPTPLPPRPPLERLHFFFLV